MKTVTPISTRGFTLIELLLVVAILAILSTVVVVVINPAELLKQARDAIRLSDLGAVNKTLSISQVSAIPLGSSTIVYVSIPDTSPVCANLGLPALPTGWFYQCASSSSYLNANGTGWIPVNFNLIPGGSSLSALPIDPVNTTSSGLYYLYVPSNTKWAIAAGLESQKYLPRAANDSGYDPGRYEIGTDLSLIAKAEGLAGWWKFDEGSDQYAYDSSGNSNTGTLNGGAAWASGKVGGALSFDGVNSYVDAGNGASLNSTSSISVGMWVKFSDVTKYYQYFMYKGPSITGGYRMFWNYSGSPNKFYFTTSDGTEHGTYTPAMSLQSDTWYYLVGVDTLSNIYFYLNAQPVTLFSTPHSIAITPGNLSIGLRNTGEGINGIIDEVRIYNRALSATEIAAIYNATK